MRRVVAQPFPEQMLLEIPQHLAAGIRAARTQTGLTLAEAAVANGISTQTMQRLEKDPAAVGFGVLLRVARNLGVSLFAVPSASQSIAQKSLTAAVALVNEVEPNHGT